ncbi:E3 ubiquitin-protein ligase rnf213-alpha-like [Saccoglossus kowalevskii]
MVLMKVHGGTTANDILKKVKESERLAWLNKTRHNVDTVLFFDEANTTEAIGLIKEVMCDQRMNGKPLTHGSNALKIIAACNPYRRHTRDMIERLEMAGLGYHIRAEKTDDRLGRIPLRQLVYRVQALPPSMLPLVWDFGQLNSEVEELYGVQDCGICLEAINEPVALPCDHVFCLKCLKELFRVTDTRACPTCRKEVSKHFRLESSAKCKEVVDAHNAFRQRCNAFFMEIVSRYCFADNEAPEPEVITKLMSYVTRESEKKGRQSKGFTPFTEDCIDPNPINPQSMNNAYFPTMHEDLLLEAKQAVKDGTKWYGEMPDGHPYTLLQCGNPASVSRCKDCNVPIGGQSSKLERGNRLARQQDATQTGHILGAPEGRHNEMPIPERQMPPVATAIVRLLMHASMLAGATKSPKDVSAAIHPAINPNGVNLFLWQHLQCDLHLLSRSSGKSVDDAALTVHMVLHRILKEKPLGGQHFDRNLKSKKSRANWEDIFTRSYISPVVENLARKLQAANHKVQNDKRLGNNPLLRLLYEVDPPSEKLTIESLYNVPTVWRYRSRVTIEHLTHALQENTAGRKKQFPILQEFLDKEYKLRALKYLPDIVHLQQLLIDEYHRNIDIHEATNLKIGRFLNKLPRGHVRDKYTRLIKSFSLAWNLVRNEIANYGGLHVSKELCSQPFHENSSIAMMLPTRKADGVCSTALVDFLIITQNEFIDQYVRIRKVDSSDDEILPCDLTPAHLIAYDPEKDLLPIVLSHCSYSLQVGHGTLVEYNLSGLERQLEERFIHGKAKIKRKIEQLVFRQDSRDAAVFESLRNRIQQESLSKAIQHQIVSEMKSLTDVCDSLACLDIAIGFLASSGGKADMYIIKYLVDTLKMDKENMKVRHPCQLKHILSLWQLLAVEKARRLTLNSQDPFDIQDFRDQLNLLQIQKLQQGLRHIHVDALVNELHDYIVIGLEKQKHLMQDEQQDVDNWKLSEILPVYIENKDGDQITGFVEHFPEDILVKHIMSTWEEVIKYQYKDASRR